jgi:hypothetical protein
LEGGDVELERMVVSVRPRSGWESLDLGFQMARQWWRQMWGIWLAIYLPIAIVAMAIFPNKFYAFLLLWWLKPLFDRALLYALSRLIFSEPSGIRETLRAARDWMRPGLFLALTLRRFELARSFQLPVAALEKQTGKPAQQRRAVLGSRMRGTAVWLTVICLHFELIAMGALFAMGNMLAPSGGDIPEDGGGRDGGFDFADLMSWNLVDAICYAGAVTLIEPFYVAAGFSLYLNRRTILEGWDMEIRLRQLGNRLRSAASTTTVALLCGFLLIGSAPHTSHAATTEIDVEAEIERILDNPDFDQYKEVTRWRPIGKKKKKQQEEEPISQFWRNLALLLSDISQGLLWVAIAILVPVLLYVLRNFLPEQFARKTEEYEPPANLFGLNVSPESLPADVSAAAAQLARASRLREALSLLYRGALSALIHRHRVVVHAGDTEGDCAEAASRALDKPGADYFTGLVGTWQQLAYGSSSPQLGEVDALCRDWALHFSTDESPAEGQAS